MSLTSPVRRVLCATDFSTSAAPALVWADTFARRERAELHVVHVWDATPMLSADAMYAAWTEALASQVESDIDRSMTAACRGRTVAARHVRRGRPDAEIVACAAAIEADLVVVGTHGRSGLPHVFLGSVAERVVRTAPVPVVTVPASWTARASRDPLVRRMLAPTDLDAGAEKRIAEIVGMAGRLDASVDLLHVMELSPYLLRHDALRADVERSTHRDLAELAQRHVRPGTRVETHVRLGQPGDTIVAVAAELDVDLVALPTHARTGASRFFLGSVAERVARTAPCPVLTLRPATGARS